MRQPRTQFARAGEVNIGYQVFGDGPGDLLWIWGLASNIEAMWDEPSSAAFLRRLGGFARVVMFDRRGAGVSDREGTTSMPTLEERVEDIIAVLDAAGSERAAAFGISEGGAMAAVAAANRPDRIDRIIIYGTAAHPWSTIGSDRLAEWVDELASGWGTTEGAEASARTWAPSMVGDERFIDWMARQRRLSCSRAAIRPLLWSSFSAYDLDDLFRAVRVPTLVLHRRDDALVPPAQARLIAEEVPGATLVELPGADHYPFLGDTESLLAEIELFISGGRDVRPGDRRLLTIAVVEVTTTAGDLRLGEDAWRELLASYTEMAHTHISRMAGSELKRSGDGIVVTFEGPGRAIRCVLAIADGAEQLGVSVRAGLHTGECEVMDADVTGVARQIAGEIADLADPGQVLVSTTVRDLVVGSGIRFGDARSVELAGLAGTRPLLEVLRHGAHPDTIRRFAIEHANVLRLDGEYWTIAFDGLVVTVRDSKGLRDLARLVAAPGRDHHVLDLSSADAALARAANAGVGEVIDETARADYRRRLTDLQEDLDDAEARGDNEAASRARATYDAVVEQLTSAYGLAGRARRAPDSVERARKAVTRRLRDALSRIERVHPNLGRHLDASIHTGVFCVYAPERDVEWAVNTPTQ